MDSFEKERIAEEDAIKATFDVGRVVITKNFEGHHKVTNNMIGIVVRREHNSYLRTLGVTVCFGNLYYEEFYKDELDTQFEVTDILISSTTMHDLSTDSKIEEYVQSPSYTNAFEAAMSRVLA